jgi:small subunit ribosomal protein S16
MLVIRMQRIGRKGHAQFRVVVQDSRRTPSSGRVVALLGSYNPHSKEVVLNKEKAQTYLDNGAQPSERVVAIFKQEGIALPNWVNDRTDKTRTVRNTEKLRKNQPAPEVEEPAVPAEAAEEVSETSTPEEA